MGRKKWITKADPLYLLFYHIYYWSIYAAYFALDNLPIKLRTAKKKIPKYDAVPVNK